MIKKVITLYLGFIFLSIFAVVGGGYINEKKMVSPPSKNGGVIQNPLMPAYHTLIPKLRSSVNVRFLEQIYVVKQDEEREPFVDFPILFEGPQKYDLVIFGDSSSYGLLPEILQRETGLRVAWLGWESQRMNREMIQFIQLVSQYLLKPQGHIILAYDYWTLDGGVNSSLVKYKNWVHFVSSMKPEEFKKYIERKSTQIAPGEAKKSEEAEETSIFGFQRYRKTYSLAKNYLAENFI